MKLSDYFKLLNEQDEIPRFESTQYNEADIVDALMGDNPEVDLKSVFGDEFWPKVKRWLDVELKDAKVNKEASNVVGGKMRAQLDIYLDHEETEYKDNAKALARNLLSSYKKWNEKEIKDQDLPHLNIG
jgi:hypothetical protein